MQTTVLLSIKPIFANRIFHGIKRYEFRKSIFKERGVNRIVVYASSPISKVIGEFQVDDVIELELEKLWAMTQPYAGIQQEYFYRYFDGREKGFAIKIGNTNLYREPLVLQKEFRIQRPPQSFMYI